MPDLIDLIYDTAVSPEHWPDLLDALSTITEDEAESVTQESHAIARHFQRAVSIAGQLAKHDDHAQLLDAALNQMPLATLLVDERAGIIAMNQLARDLNHKQQLMACSSGQLTLNRANSNQKLLTMISDEDYSSGLSKPLKITGDGIVLSLMVIDIALVPAVHYGQVKLVLVAESDQALQVSKEYLRSHFGLTNAEARLAQDFVVGGSLRELAEQYQITYNTIRTQMKHVMAKVGVQRQSELVQQILSGPFALISGTNKQKALPDYQSMQLADGRQMAWAEYGPANGQPVFLCHSSIWSRLQRHPDDTILHRNKLRLIVPDRPGYGRSDPLDGRTLLGWSQDLVQLADHLGIRQFGLMGIMLGADYALATASVLGDRVNSVALLSARVSPSSCPGYKPSSKIIALLEKLSVKSPGLLSTTIRLIFRDVMQRPKPYIDRFMGKGGEKDRAAWEDGVLPQIFLDSLREANRQAVGNAFVEDWMILHRPCEYGPEDISAPVSVWHGRKEMLTSVDCIEHLVKRLPNAQLHIIEDGNRFVFHHQWPDAIEFLAARRS